MGTASTAPATPPYVPGPLEVPWRHVVARGIVRLGGASGTEFCSLLHVGAVTSRPPSAPRRAPLVEASAVINLWHDHCKIEPGLGISVPGLRQGAAGGTGISSPAAPFHCSRGRVIPSERAAAAAASDKKNRRGEPAG